MATKSNGKGQAHGSSRSHAPSHKGGAAAKQHKNSASAAGHGASNSAHRSNKARPSQASKSEPRRDSKRPGSESKPQRRERSGQAERHGKAQPREGGVSGMTRKVARTAKQHPIVTAAISAGAGLLLVEGVRRAITGGMLGGGRGKADRDEGSSGEDDSDQDDEPEGGAVDSAGSGDEDDAGDRAGGAPEARRRDSLFGDGADRPPLTESLKRGLSHVTSAARGGAASMRHAAQEGFEHGQQLAAESWQNHPLMVCAAALALGATIGMMLPPSALEDQAMGAAADRVTGRIQSASRKLLRRGKDLFGKAYDEATDTAVREAERVGLTPARLGRKVKRLAGKVRDAVTDAVQG